MSSIKKVAEFAQTYLKQQPFDLAHDFAHHQLVYHNCLSIIKNEHLTQADQDVITVAAWWHDVEKNPQAANSAQSTVAFFRKKAQELGLAAETIDRCAKVIGEHSFSETQTTLESRILFDADKIEYVNADRIRTFALHALAHPEQYDLTELQRLYRTWCQRIEVLPKRMHFNYSKQQFVQYLNEAKESLKQLAEAAHLTV